MRKFDFIIREKWIGFHFLTFTGMMAGIYKYVIQLGILEIRRWR